MSQADHGDICAQCGALRDPDGTCPTGCQPQSGQSGTPSPGHGRTGRTEDGPTAIVVRLADVQPERVRWLWPGYLPLGKLVTVDGDPGAGKSTLCLDLAARVTTRTPMPDGTEPAQGGALILSAEDGLADTIRPRLDAAGADPARVVTITEIPSADGPGRPVSLPGDLSVIEQVIHRHGVVLVIVDVLMAYLGGGVDAHRDQDIRRALHPLAAMAERTGCCVLVLRHLNKRGGTNALYRGGGSIGIVGAARAGFVIGTDPDDESGQRRVLACAKSNLAAMPPALAYRLAGDELHGCARVSWEGASEHSASALLAEPGDPDERSDRDAAADWLAGYLADLGGEAPAKEVKAAARSAGFAERTLDRARNRAGVTTGRSGFGRGAVYVWRLDRACAPHVRHVRQDTDAGEHGIHDGATESDQPDGTLSW